MPSTPSQKRKRAQQKLHVTRTGRAYVKVPASNYILATDISRWVFENNGTQISSYGTHWTLQIIFAFDDPNTCLAMKLRWNDAINDAWRRK